MAVRLSVRCAMPLCILLLIAVAPVLAMVATAGNALGRGPQLAAAIALTIVLSAVVMAGGGNRADFAWDLAPCEAGA
jgi:hypothetical protein